MMDAVHRFEGTVNQVLGDGIMALFGAPIAHEDHALRACYAALAMQTAMRTYAEEVRRAQGMVLQMRVGLNSGEVVVRAIGNDLHMDYSAVGQTHAPGGAHGTAGHAGEHPADRRHPAAGGGPGAGQRPGAVPVKGLTEPVEVFELVGASGLRRRLQAAAARGLTRFVGRQPELAALHQALAQAGAGHGQVVALVGEAGVGKSRLVYEFVHAHRTQGWRVLESASVSYGKATPYFPVMDLLKRYCQWTTTMTPHHPRQGDRPGADAGRALQDTLPALLSLLEALPEDSPFLHLDPPQRRQRTLDGAASACCCAKARCSRCCWSLRTCTGSTPRPRPCSTAWSRACRRPASCSWSTTARSTSTAGAARRTTRNCGSTRCRRPAPKKSCRPCWGTIPAWCPSSSS